MKQELRQILAREEGAQVFPPGARTGFALAYPNSYYVGMSNLGMHILYAQINGRGDTACERFFLPDGKLAAQYARSNAALLSLETQRPLYSFPLIGFAVSFEMDYFHVLEMLEQGKVKLRASERGDRDPLVLAGGPCATFNPEPLGPFIDAFIIGEGEEFVQEFLDAYYEASGEGLGREALLLRLAQVEGVYVPRFYEHVYGADGILREIVPREGVPAQVRRRWVRNLDDYEGQTVIASPDTEFGGMFLLEIARGCGRHCRFCMAGYCFRKPRARSLEMLRAALPKAAQKGLKVGLMGAAVSDHPEIDALCRAVLDAKLAMSVASFRADSVTPTLVEALAESGLKTLTLAPEAGSERLRRIINKGIGEAHLLHAIDLGAAAGIAHFRLYLMIGLPFEEDEDIEAIALLAQTVKAHMEARGSRGKLTLSVNPFVPKPLTPFQWLPMASQQDVERRLGRIRQAAKALRGVEVIAESPKAAYVQAVLARGDRRVGEALLAAHRMGGAKAFKRALKTCGLDEAFYLSRLREENEVFPWNILDMGFARRYLYQELENARQQKATLPCFEGCTRCGVCKKAEEGGV